MAKTDCNFERTKSFSSYFSSLQSCLSQQTGLLHTASLLSISSSQCNQEYLWTVFRTIIRFGANQSGILQPLQSFVRLFDLLHPQFINIIWQESHHAIKRRQPPLLTHRTRKACLCCLALIQIRNVEYYNIFLMRLSQLLALAVFTYLAFHMVFVLSGSSLEQATLQSRSTQVRAGVFIYFSSLFSWIMELIQCTVTLIWSIFSYIGPILVVMINIVYTGLMYLHGKNLLQYRRGTWFFIIFFLLVVIPLIINWLIANPQLTFNLFLPVQTGIFADVLNPRRFRGKSIRNIIVLVILCSFI